MDLEIVSFKLSPPIPYIITYYYILLNNKSKKIDKKSIKKALFSRLPKFSFFIQLSKTRPLVSQLYHDGIIEAAAYGQKSVFDAAVIFLRTEGIIPAPESSHAIRAAMDEALKAKESGEEKVILFNLSGHGYFDMAAYDYYFSGKMEDFEYSEEAVNESMKNLPRIEI